MKTNRMIAVLVLMLLVALCMVLTACGSDPVVVGENPGAHEHEATNDTETPGDSEEELGESVCLHKETEIKDKKAATCLAQGYTGDKVCSACGKVMEAGSVTPVGECDFEDTEVLFEATCETVGIKLCTCKVCFDTRNESIPELGHAIERVDEIEDAVLNVSHDSFHTERCTREGCGYEVQVQHTGRTYSYPASCDYPAYIEGTCTVCRVKYRIYDTTTEPTGHAFAEDGWTQTTAPTCQTAGEETRQCTNAGCNKVETRPVEIDPEAHKWSEGVTNGDVIDYECLNEGCEATKQEPVVVPDETPEG